MSEKSVTNAFAKEEEGGITVLSLFLFVGMLMAAGLAIDVNNMLKSRTQLQGAADAAGHAALYWSWRNDTSAAKTKAIEIAELNMPRSIYGDVLATVDIEFGDYVPAENGNPHYFDETSSAETAVQVTTVRSAAKGNGLASILMKFLGLDILDMKTVSVWDYEEGWCPRGEGFFAVGIVDIQSNNTYQDGFCIHSDVHVEFQQGSDFQGGVVVSMPNEADIVLSSSGLTQNTGLEDALESKNLNLKTFFNDLPDLIGDYADPTSSLNSSLTSTTINRVRLKNSEKLTQLNLVPNSVNIVECGNNGTLSIPSGALIQDAVIITSCEVSIGSSAALENVTLISTATSAKAIEAGSNVRVGDLNYCNTGKRGSTVISMGGFSTSSGLQAHGANVIAAGDISTTAGAGGLGGINFMAGGRIDATSGGDMGFCASGPPTPFRIPVFRMVM